MSTTVKRQQNYITQVRDMADSFWKAYQFLLTAQGEWTAQNYAENLPDGTGANEGITADEVHLVVFDTANAIKEVMEGQHSTNITSLLK